MKAIVYAEKNKVEIWDDLEPPKLEYPVELSIKTEITGVSLGTERHQLIGGAYQIGFPMIPGYQTIGKAEEVGSQVGGVNVGDYVLTDYSKPPANYEEKGIKYVWWTFGHMGNMVTQTPGFLEVGGKISMNTVRIPSFMDLEEASLIPVASIGLSGFGRAELQPGQKVFVNGLGIIGQFAAQAAKALGAEVFAADIDKWRLDMAKQYSCDEVLGPSLEEINNGLQDYGPFDLTVETTAAKNTMNTCISAIKPGGKVLAIGGRVTMEYDNLMAQMSQAKIIHTSHFLPQNAIDVMNFVRKGMIKIKPLITHRLKLKDAPDFYHSALKPIPKLMGITIDWR